jgi:hypothetical protein
MTNSVSIAGLTQGGTQAPTGPSSAAVVSLPQSNIDSKPLTQANSTPISPRIVVDPLAGVITEFLNTNGQLQSQIPSAAVVAYLRAGLTPDGQTKPSAKPHSQNAENNTILA